MMFTNDKRASRNDPEGKKYNNATKFKKVGTGAEHSVSNGLDNGVKRVGAGVPKKAVVQEAYVEDDE
jgi:hypothetical protein